MIYSGIYYSLVIKSESILMILKDTACSVEIPVTKEICYDDKSVGFQMVLWKLIIIQEFIRRLFQRLQSARTWNKTKLISEQSTLKQALMAEKHRNNIYEGYKYVLSCF